MGSAWIDEDSRTERLTLRRPTLVDAARVAAFVGDGGVARNLARAPHPYGREDAEAFLGGLDGPRRSIGPSPSCCRRGLRRHGRGPHRAWRALGRDRLLARPSLLGTGAGDRGGACDDRPYRRAGRAARARLRPFVDNPASGRVLEKAGFLYTGEVRARLNLARGQAVATRMMVRLG